MNVRDVNPVTGNYALCGGGRTYLYADGVLFENQVAYQWS